MEQICRTFDAVVDSVNKDDMSIVARINTSSKDRYNTVIPARGGKFKNWRAAGSPVLWEHGKDARRFTDPIATSKNIWNNGGPTPTEIIAEPRFLTDDFSRQRFEWYRDEVIKGWSVNILPTGNSGPPTKEELRSRPDWEGVGQVYREWDLAEFSGTVIPGNAEAVTADRAALIFDYVLRGMIWLPDEAKPIYEEAKTRQYVDPPLMTDLPATVPDIPGSIERDAPWIDHAGGVYIVRAADGATILSTADESVAKQCLGVLGSTKSFEAAHHAITQEIRTSFHEFRTDIAALMDLMIHGRV